MGQGRGRKSLVSCQGEGEGDRPVFCSERSHEFEAALVGKCVPGRVVMKKGRVSGGRNSRTPRPWWCRRGWWIVFGAYGVGLSLVLGMLAQQRWGRRSAGIESDFSGGLETQPLRGGMTAESMARGFAPESLQESYQSAWGIQNGGKPGVPAPWLPTPEMRREMESDLGPGLRDVKLVTYELPDLKDVGGR